MSSSSAAAFKRVLLELTNGIEEPRGRIKETNLKISLPLLTEAEAKQLK